jgi:hypothetical protein
MLLAALCIKSIATPQSRLRLRPFFFKETLIDHIVELV